MFLIEYSSSVAEKFSLCGSLKTSAMRWENKILENSKGLTSFGEAFDFFTPELR